jgi:hypothetical protein
MTFLLLSDRFRRGVQEMARGRVVLLWTSKHTERDQIFPGSARLELRCVACWGICILSLRGEEMDGEVGKTVTHSLLRRAGGPIFSVVV